MDITFEGKTETINAGNREFMDLEDKFNVAISDFQENMKLTYLTYLAYRGLWWQRKFTGTWEEFRQLDTNVDIQETGDAFPKEEQTASQEPALVSPTTPVDSPTESYAS